jgi:hypothetical protein
VAVDTSGLGVRLGETHRCAPRLCPQEKCYACAYARKCGGAAGNLRLACWPASVTPHLTGLLEP